MLAGLVSFSTGLPARAGGEPLVELPLSAAAASSNLTLAAAHASAAPLQVQAKTPDHEAKLARWRSLAQNAERQLNTMGGVSNVTVLPAPNVARRNPREQLPRRETHLISGEREELGAADEDRAEAHSDLKPRGKEWRRQLARRINEERLSHWREGEKTLRGSGRWQSPATAAPAPLCSAETCPRSVDAQSQM